MELTEKSTLLDQCIDPTEDEAPLLQSPLGAREAIDTDDVRRSLGPAGANVAHDLAEAPTTVLPNALGPENSSLTAPLALLSTFTIRPGVVRPGFPPNGTYQGTENPFRHVEDSPTYTDVRQQVTNLSIMGVDITVVGVTGRTAPDRPSSLSAPLS